MNVLFLLVGIALGGIAGYFFAKSKFVSEKGLSKNDLDKDYVLKELYLKLEEDLRTTRGQNTDKESLILELSSKIATNEQIISNLNEKIEKECSEIEALQKKLQLEFENIANRILEEKSTRFLETNKKNLDVVLNPFKERIDEFKKKVEDIYNDENRERASLKTEVKQLLELNRLVSDEANKLAVALKGDSKIQGDWGEVQLEMILERAGLVKDTHYKRQSIFKDSDGQDKKPDYMVLLPDSKHVVIDSKVSLTAYVDYVNCADDQKREDYLKAHLESIIKHIKELSAKDYQSLYQINSPDYVIMFMPIEPALILALKQDPTIFEKALEKNVILLMASTLFPTLKTIAFMWKQENQRKNVIEIADRGGELYDKFVDFVDFLRDIGKKLDSAKGSYDEAIKKLTEAKRRGDTLIGKAESLKKLGVNASKSLPQDMIAEIDETK